MIKRNIRIYNFKVIENVKAQVFELDFTKNFPGKVDTLKALGMLELLKKELMDGRIRRGGEKKNESKNKTAV